MGSELANAEVEYFRAKREVIGIKEQLSKLRRELKIAQSLLRAAEIGISSLDKDWFTEEGEQRDE